MMDQALFHVSCAELEALKFTMWSQGVHLARNTKMNKMQLIIWSHYVGNAIIKRMARIQDGTKRFLRPKL